jgi:hypothetical protein
MRLPRMTIRRWIVAVAAVAVLVRSAQVAVRWHQYRKRAEYHAVQYANLQVILAPVLEFQRAAGRFPGCGLLQDVWERECEKAEWHSRLKSKYERAAAHPWVPAEPDLPEPE